MKSSKRLGRTGIALDIFEGGSSIKENECFVDLGLIPEEQSICDPTLIAIFAELCARCEWKESYEHHP